MASSRWSFPEATGLEGVFDGRGRAGYDTAMVNVAEAVFWVLGLPILVSRTSTVNVEFVALLSGMREMTPAAPMEAIGRDVVVMVSEDGLVTMRPEPSVPRPTP
jgi:hypothetical protein